MKQKKTTLTAIDLLVYDFLKEKYKEDATRWISKQEIMEGVPELSRDSGTTSHDICSRLNLTRIRLNRASHDESGEVNHIVLLNNSKFKIAANKEEAEKYLYKDFEDGIKRITRYHQNMRVLKRNGQGKCIDNNNKAITEEEIKENIKKMFVDIFAS